MPTAQEALIALLSGPNYKQRTVLPTEDYEFAGDVPTQGELSSPFEREQTARAGAADVRDRKAVSDVLARNAEVNDYLRPDVTEVRQSQQRDKLAQLLAVPQQQGQNAIAVEQERQRGALAQGEQQHKFTQELIGGGGRGVPNDQGGKGFTPSVNAAGGVSLRGVPAHKPTTEEQRALDTMGSLSALGPEMLSRYEAEYPGIGGPGGVEKYGGPMDMLKSALGAGAYKTGFVGNERSDQMTQLTGYLEAVLPRMLSSGRINREQYLDLKLHVPQVGLSPGANYGRAKYVLDTILPHVRSAIGSQPGGQNDDPYSNPDYQPR